jgi:hypothetical protein
VAELRGAAGGRTRGGNQEGREGTTRDVPTTDNTPHMPTCTNARVRKCRPPHATPPRARPFRPGQRGQSPHPRLPAAKLRTSRAQGCAAGTAGGHSSPTNSPRAT